MFREQCRQLFESSFICNRLSLLLLFSRLLLHTCPTLPVYGALVYPVSPEEELEDNPSSDLIEQAAEMLYGLIHSRFILTNAGICKMVGNKTIKPTPHPSPLPPQNLSPSPPFSLSAQDLLQVWLDVCWTSRAHGPCYNQCRFGSCSFSVCVWLIWSLHHQARHFSVCSSCGGGGRGGGCACTCCPLEEGGADGCGVWKEVCVGKRILTGGMALLVARDVLLCCGHGRCGLVDVWLLLQALCSLPLSLFDSRCLHSSLATVTVASSVALCLICSSCRW